MSYIGGCIDALLANGHRAMEVRKDVHDAFTELNLEVGHAAGHGRQHFHGARGVGLHNRRQYQLALDFPLSHRADRELTPQG